MALGVYPEVTLADARAKREDAKRGIAGGIDPMEAKREEKIARETQLNNTFKDIALEWHSSKLKKWSAGYASDILEAFNKDVFPYIGKKPIAEIKPLELLNVLRRIEGRGATEKAKKVRQRCGEVFRYAIVTGRAEYNPAPDLTSAMQGHESNHYPFLTAKELPDFFKALSSYSGSALVVMAARLLIITGLRRGNYTTLHSESWAKCKIRGLRQPEIWGHLASTPKQRPIGIFRVCQSLISQALKHYNNQCATFSNIPTITTSNITLMLVNLSGSNLNLHRYHSQQPAVTFLHYGVING